MNMIKTFIVSLMSIAMLSGMVPGNFSSASGVKPSGAAITPPSVLRFRVIANSDNPVDQAVKLKVRDAMLRIMEPPLSKVTSVGGAQAVIRHIVPKLDKAANAVLVHYHLGYRAHIHLTTTKFPTKAYGSWVLPAGRYHALLVVLGKGQGHNWWCVLFPSLCFIDMSNSLAVPTTTAAVQRKKTPEHATIRAARTYRSQDESPSQTPSTSPSAPSPHSATESPHHPGISPSRSTSRHQHGHIRVSWRAPHVVKALFSMFG